MRPEKLLHGTVASGPEVDVRLRGRRPRGPEPNGQPGLPFAIGDGRLLVVHVSAGCASGPLGAFEGTVLAADEALYEAKETGRNRVVSRSP